MSAAVANLVARPEREASDALPAARAAGRHPRVEALLARLATTARTLAVYDIRNDTVRRALGALLDAFAEVLAADPYLGLTVRPFEIELDGERVYADRDRERSLAFRLYRDGIRTLAFHRGFDGAELALMLEILSVRYAGVHQHEDDTVTLLWKARLRFVDVVAVDGLTADDGPPVGLAPASALAAHPFLPDDADLSVVTASGAARPEWTEPEPADLDLLRGELAAAALPRDLFALLAALEKALDDSREKLCFRELAHLWDETRDFLVCSGNLPALLAFVRQLRRLARSDAPWDGGRQTTAAGILGSCGSDRVVRRLIHGVPDDQRLARRELVDLLELACADPFAAVAEALASEERPASRAVARQLLERFGRDRAEHLRQRFDEAQGRVAADLLRSLTGLEGQAPLAFLARQCGHTDPEVREEALWHLERAPFTTQLGAALVEALRRTRGEHRRRVLAVIERSRDRRFVEPLFAFVSSDLEDVDEAVAVAGVLGRLEGHAALARWRPWLRPRGRFLHRRLAGSHVQQAAAAAAVAEVPGDEATALLSLARSAARGDLRRQVDRFLRRRVLGVGSAS